jgi:hypothetical protein
MLSPAGVQSRPEDFDLDMYVDNIPGERRMPKFMYKLAPIVCKARISLSGMMRTSGSLLSNLQINNYMKNQIKAGAIPDEELEDYKEYLH